MVDEVCRRVSNPELQELNDDQDRNRSFYQMVKSRSVNTPISLQYLQECLPDTNVKLYKQLSRISNMNTLLGKSGKLLLLYRSSESFGHVTCIFRRSDGSVELFDSYGILPDRELDWSTTQNSELGQGHAYLTKILKKFMSEEGNVVYYNDHKIQSSSSMMCGAWCVLRLCNTDLTTDEFYKWCLTNSRKLEITLDEYADRCVKIIHKQITGA